jgi:hypothetical protein
MTAPPWSSEVGICNVIECVLHNRGLQATPGLQATGDQGWVPRSGVAPFNAQAAGCEAALAPLPFSTAFTL